MSAVDKYWGLPYEIIKPWAQPVIMPLVLRIFSFVGFIFYSVENAFTEAKLF
jgi:hypothetical protein